jgi:hypothetical protein
MLPCMPKRDQCNGFDIEDDGGLVVPAPLVDATDTSSFLIEGSKFVCRGIISCQTPQCAFPNQNILSKK